MTTTTKPEFVHYPIKISRMMPDRTPYKVYGIEIVPDDLYVDVVLTYDMIVSHPTDMPTQDVLPIGGRVVLTPRGLAFVAKQLADAVDKMHTQFLKEDE